MSKLFIKLITGYQKLISPLLKQLLGVSAFCRYSPTCSGYAKIAIDKHGILRGGIMASKRLLTCQPFKKYEFINIT